MTGLNVNSLNSRGFNGKTSTALISENPFLNVHTNIIGIGESASTLESTTNRRNIFIGNSSGKNNTISEFNTIIGHDAALALSRSTKNVILGDSAGKKSSGSQNTYIGTECSLLQTTGNKNVAIGTRCAMKLSGNNNVSIGHQCIPTISAFCNDNVFIGNNALNISTNVQFSLGNDNIVIGSNISVEECLKATVNNNIENVVNIGNVLIGGNNKVFLKLEEPTDNQETHVLTIDKTTNEVKRGAKTFVIEHPLYNDMYLVHACLEGPENAVFYRGKACTSENLKRNVELPEYLAKLVDISTITIQLQAIKKLAILCVNNITEAYFEVESNVPVDFYWELKGTRKDIEPLEVKIERTSATVCGTGPYTYIS